MHRPPSRFVPAWSFGTKNNGLLYLQIEEISTLNAALAIFDGNTLQDEFDGSVITRDSLNSRELLQGFSADRFGEEFHELTDRLKLAGLKPGSRDDPRARGIGSPEKSEQSKIAFLVRNFTHRLSKNSGGNHRTSDNLSTHVPFLLPAAVASGQ
jgi:hypothetical protein